MTHIVRELATGSGAGGGGEAMEGDMMVASELFEDGDEAIAWSSFVVLGNELG